MIANAFSAEGYRLSSQQEHLWLLQRDGPPLAAQCAIAIDGALDPQRLLDALRRVVDRHEILCTAFQRLPGVAVPLQVIDSRPAVPWVEHDLRGLGPDEQKARVDEIWRGLQAGGLDLAATPLLTAALLELAAERHLLLVHLPALCADRVSLELLAAEIGRAYEAAPRGEEDGSEAMQYVDFCEWQHEILDSADTAAGREFWARQNLAALLGVRLPAAAAAGEGGMASVRVELEPDRAAEIMRLKEPEPFLLACWQILLARLTGGPEVLVGVLSDGRKFAELRAALGAFAQRLPVRCRIDEEMALRDLLRRVEDARREAYDWQEAFTWRGIRGAAGGGGEPEFPFGFELAARPVSFTAAGLTLTLQRWSVASGRPEVELVCLCGDRSLELEIRFDAGRLDRPQAELLAGRLQALIGAALAFPEAAVGDLESLSTAERDFLLGELNATAAPFPQECIHRLLGEQAERTPEARAVISGDEILTYRELHERANRLARFLHARGVGPEVRVGICLDRSPEMLVGMLGILKAGGAYVPIDPAYPVDRLAFMIAEADGPVVLTRERFREALAGYGRPLVCLDSDWPEIGREDATPPAPVRPENLAYVIYTSGSTGRPKGVLVSHRNLVHSTSARLGYYRHPVQSFLLVSSFAFDSSVVGIYGTLAQGGTLVLPEEDIQRDVPRLLDLLDRWRVSHLLSLPSLYSNLLDAAAEPGRLAALREVIVAGEACPPALVGRHRTRLPEVPLYNEYGPTEGTVWSTVHELTAGGDDVLIGRPIANMQVYLLNPRLRPVMLGSPGELFIAGEGLARGYHDRSDLTAGRFIPNPFAGPAEPGGRLYRTGDLARCRPDGCLEFLGRVDRQVKIRGYRIELEEIEAALGRHPDLRQVAVAAREDVPGDLRLVAYLVAERGNALQVSELRAFVAAALPEYMVPAAFVPLDALPLTPNGKVDRQALPTPGSARSALQGSYAAPSTLSEEVMADIWAAVLGIEQVGARDNFFDLGGHSLLATQLVSRLREAFQVDLTLIWLFEAPTIQRLAARVDAARREGAAIADLPILRVDRGGELPLSFGQQRLWFLDQLAPGTPLYNVAKSFRVTGPLDPAALERTLTEVVRRHEVLRTVFDAVDGRPLQKILPASPHALPVVDLRQLHEEERRETVRRLAAEEVARPFDLSRGPLLRSTLLLLAPQEFGVLFTMHHIVSDAWSMNLLVREMTVLYEAFAAGRPSPLPELEIQFADFAVWQRRRLQGAALEAELAYWRERLAEAPAVIDLPTDRPRPAVQTFRGGEVPFAFPAALSGAAKALARSHGVTLFMVLLGAFQALLGRYSRQDDVCVGTPIAGRNRRQIEGLIGFFVNTLVLRADLREKPSFRQLLRQVRELSLEAHAHQDLPFEKLVEELAPERSLTHAPLFQVMFALQHPRLEGAALADLRLGSLVAERDTVKFDLTLATTETPAGIRGAFGYNRDLFDVTTAIRMLEHLEALVEAAVSRPDEPLSGLPLLRRPERHQVEVEWNEAAPAWQPETVIGRFEVRAEKTPQAEALTFEGESLTYRELNRRANRLAHHLRSLGVAAESRVGLCVERSVELAVAILAIFKAGGAYVPLDPSYPQSRLRLMLEDARVAVLVTASSLVPDPDGIGAPVVFLDGDREAIAARSDGNPPATPAASDLAYLIYTSGTTGKPKAVMVEHGQLASTLLGSLRELAWSADDRGLCLASYSFDIFLFELLSPLLAGGTAVLFPLLRQGVDVDRLAELLPELTVIHAVPALMRQWVQAVRESPRRLDLSRLRSVFVGGDAVSSDLLVEMRAAFPGAAIRVLYGPTEATIICSSYRVPEAPQPIRSRIGRPLPNAVLSLRDEEGRPVAVGVPGEIHVGGAGVARGYWNREELTAERFVSVDGQRYYRTGDLARHLPDGTLEFLGRLDQQVKVRGFRIEPGEVEAALRTHPGVAETVVLATGEGGADRRLVAYVVPAQAASVELWPSIGEYSVYDELIYHGLTSDAARNAKYMAAMERLAAGKVVVDVGTGRDAIQARLCIAAGAARVYAIELLEESYRAARELIQRLGLADRVTVLHGDAAAVELPEPADVCVSEIVEAIAGAEGAAVILNGARRLLKTDGVMIPAHSSTLIAAARLPEELRRDPSFTEVSAHYVEKIFAEVGHPFDLRLCVKGFPASHVMSDAAVFEDLDFSGPVAPEFRRRLTLTVREGGRLDGFLLWLRMEMGAGEVLDIMEEAYSWFPVFFPAFAPGVDVEAGDVVELEAVGELSDDGLHPDYSVAGRVLRRRRSEVRFALRSPHHGEAFRSNPFYADLFRDGSIPVRRGAARLAADLKRHLGGLLPEFMVPSAIVPLDELPLTPNGKVDRRRLPEPERARVAPAARVAPRTPLEKTVAGIWSEVLGIPELGVHDDFFDLGGHSLLATQVVTRVRRTLRKEVSLRLLFEARSVARMAEALARSPEAPAEPELEPIRPLAPQVQDLDELLREFEQLSLTDDQVVR